MGPHNIIDMVQGRATNQHGYEIVLGQLIVYHDLFKKLGKIFGYPYIASRHSSI